MFILDGLIPLRTAVEVIAATVDPASMDVPKPNSVRRGESLNPLSQARTVSSEPFKQPTDAERQEIADWKKTKSKQNQAREEARRRIRRVLGNGWEQATAQRSDGKHIELAAEPWRTLEGVKVLWTGNVTTNGLFAEMVPAKDWPVFVPESAVQKCLDAEWTPGPASPANREAIVRHAGGRPPKHDWTPFIQQLVRIAWLDGGNLTRTELRRQMKVWAAANMPDADDRTIEKKLVELVPDDLLTD